MRITMYPPPPRLPASGYVTARATPTATAASTALPPRRRVSTPARVASESLLDTIAVGAYEAAPPALNCHSGGTVALANGPAVSVDGGRQVVSARSEIANATGCLRIMYGLGSMQNGQQRGSAAEPEAKSHTCRAIHRRSRGA